MGSTNRRKVEQDHESVSEADLEEQLRSRDEQLANGGQVVCTETEDETGDDQRIEEQLDDETVGEETEDEADDGSDDDREDDERNEEEDDGMDEEESGGKERDEADECVDRKKSAVYLHVLSRPDCLSVYDDSHFSVLCRARYVQQLKVLEAVCIRIHKPV